VVFLDFLDFLVFLDSWISGYFIGIGYNKAKQRSVNQQAQNHSFLS